MKRLSPTQQATLIRAHKRGGIIGIPAQTRKALVNAGYIQPIGMASGRLTAKGIEWNKHGGHKNNC